jgi:asparagine synthase (glutamine-hydrolysing)
MCGISGIFGNIDEKEDIKIIKEIIKLQKNRGPDSNNYLTFEKSIMGHNRLKIIDLTDTGLQPMESEKYCIVFNGEIYNYQELRNNYLSDISFKGSSDTEVLLYLFEKFGIKETLAKLNGMFAIGLYDKLEKKLYLMRDRMGEKPLYYYIDNTSKKLYFASNLKSIFLSLYNLNSKEWHVNYQAVYHFLLLGGCWEGESLVKDIYKLEKASYLEIDSNINIKKNVYWYPKLNNNNFTNLLERSIKLRKIADVPLSILYSGGIDSSVLAYFSEGTNCVHLCNGEEKYAKQIAEKLNVKFIEKNTEKLNISKEDMYKYLQKYIEFSGEPSMPAIIPMLTLDSVKDISTVVLTGNGGDEICYGYNRTPVLDKKLDKNMNICKNKIKNNTYKDTKNYSSEDFQLLHIFRHPEKFSVSNAKSYTFDEFKNLIHSSIKIDERMGKEAFYRYLEFCTFVQNDLNPTLDYSSMYYSLEVRAPFLDHNVIESGLSMTSLEHISDNDADNWEFSRKNQLKKILSNKLHESLYNRNKLGFSLPPYLAKIYGEIMGKDSLDKLVKRGILKVNNLNLGCYARDLSYLYSSCTGLEEWFVQYVDTEIIKF